jgi:hypothetical protein
VDQVQVKICQPQCSQAAAQCCLNIAMVTVPASTNRWCDMHNNEHIRCWQQRLAQATGNLLVHKACLQSKNPHSTSSCKLQRNINRSSVYQAV